MKNNMTSIISRSWLAVSRKPRRSAIIALIVTLVFSALVSQAGISAAVEGVEQQLQSSIGSGFTVSAKTRGETLQENSVDSNSSNADANSNTAETNSPIPQDLAANEGISSRSVRQFAKIPGVKTVVEERDILASAVGKQLVLPSQGPRLDSDVMASLAGITGTTYSRLSHGFQEGLYRLERGEHIDNHSVGSAIVHRDFAKKNKLKVGSTITFKQGITVTVRIVGIFTGKLQTRGALPSDASENRIFTDLASALKLAGSSKRSVIRCMVQNSNLLAQAIKHAKNIAGKSMDVEQNASQLSDVMQSVHSVQQLVLMIFIVLSFVGVLVLGLVLVFWVRGRMHEIGVLMALGIEKSVIFVQLLVEIMIISLISCVISLGLGAVFSGAVGSTLLNSITDSAFVALNVPILPLWQTLAALAIGLVIALVALFIAVLPILLKKPRKILSAMS